MVPRGTRRTCHACHAWLGWLGWLLVALFGGCERSPAAGAPSAPPSTSSSEAVLASARTAEDRALTERLLREFEGAYPREVRPSGRVRSFQLTAEEKEVPLVDGRRLRVWSYNGQVPGPLLRVRVGDTVRVTLTNRLPQPTTIHWHGVRVPNDMDGVPYNPRPPIAPGQSFTYEFVAKDAGTYWYHPHIRSSEQVERGLYGVLVIEEAQPPPYTREVIWVLDDWRLDESGQIDGHFNTRHDLAHDGRWGRHVTVNGRTDETLRVRAGERIRLRLVNTANGRVFLPDFSGLDAKVIAVDGLYLSRPLAPAALGSGAAGAAGLELAPGNRVDLDITFGSVSQELVVWDRFIARRPNRLATIIVDDVAPAAPAFAPPARAHVPAWRDALKLPVAKELRLNARRGGRFGLEWTINDIAFAGHEHAAAHGHGDVAATLAAGQIYRLRFVNESYRLHPMHIHGMFFRLLARDGQPVDEPFFRDTVLVGPRQTVDIAVVPLDAGKWMMHCHILEHAESGMMTMLAVQR